MEQLKKCRKCKKELLLSSFFKDKSCRDGRMGICKGCAYIQQKAWRKENPIKVAIINATKYAKNPEKYRAYQREYRKTHIEKSLARDREWKKANKEKVIACSREWKKANKEKVLSASRSWKKAHREKTRSDERKRHAVNMENINVSYLKKLICQSSSLQYNDIPKELINLKRAQILLARKLKELEK